MSFKERIINYCKGEQGIDCHRCTFKVPCDKVRDYKIPEFFTDAEMTMFEGYVKEHRRKLSSQLNDTYKVLSGSSGFVGFLSAKPIVGGQDDLKIVKGGRDE